MTNKEIVQAYLSSGYRCVFWAATGDAKGPREEGWQNKTYVLADYTEGNRVGLMTGVEVTPGQYLTDFDQDWSPGAKIALMLMPPTNFVYGRAGKPVSHLMHLLEVALPSFRYEDVDKTVLSEIRGTKTNGEIGLQTMVPPSFWSPKGVANPTQDQLEELIFVHAGDPASVKAAYYKRWANYTNIAQIIAKNCGKHGFGHEVRLMFAGYLLRLKIAPEDIIRIGEAVSMYCENTEVHDVRTAVMSTESALQDPKKKVKGGPALAKHLGTNGKAIIARIAQWLGEDNDFVRNKDGAVIADNQDNIRKALMQFDIEVSYNNFNEGLYVRVDGHVVPLTDQIVDRVWLRIDSELRFRPTFTYFEKVLRDMAYSNEFHPVRQYLDSLVWDDVPRLDRMLEVYAGVAVPEGEGGRYVTTVSANFLKGAVRRVRHPGCKLDEMVVFEGNQGAGKSSFIQFLLPEVDWFSDDLPLNVDAKQIIERTLGKWIIEASDLVGGRKADREHLKSMMSRQIDGPVRLAYGRNAVSRARQFCLAGTTNAETYLEDPTGARRFLPICTTTFDLEQLKKDRDQLWAEAAHREALGESIHLPKELWAEAGKQQDQRQHVDAWEELVEGLISASPPSSSGQQRIALEMLWTYIGVVPERRDRAGSLRLADIMRRLGFQRGMLRVEGKLVRGYLRQVPEGWVVEQMSQSPKPGM